MMLSALIAGYLLDLCLGDPQHWPHPVRWIGSTITCVQRVIRRLCRSQRALYVGGGVLWLVVVGGTWLSVSALMALLAFNPLASWLAQAWLIYTLLATRGLRDAAMAVYYA